MSSFVSRSSFVYSLTKIIILGIIIGCWSVASQLVAVGMITDQNQKDYIPFQEQMSSKRSRSL